MRILKFQNIDKVYIVLTAVIFSIVYLTVLSAGNMYMFIDIGADTYCSYWPSIAYVKDLLGDFKLWDMKLGLGNSTITYISYFLADPFQWFCFIFDDKNIDIGIFIGLAFKYFCLSVYAYKYIGIKKMEGYPKIICSLMIVFSGWFVGWGQHYNFATVFVFFIMVLYYFECWLNKSGFVKLVISIMLLAIVSPYYAYMTLLFLAVYYLLRLYDFCKCKMGMKEAAVHALKTAGMVMLGLGCSAVIFLPYMSEVLSSPRVSGQNLPSFRLGTLQEYASMFLRLFSNSILGINENFAGYGNFYECPFMYVGILFVLVIPLFLFRKQTRKACSLYIICSLFSFVFLNFSSAVFNAFSTKSYRWTFVFIPVFAAACGKALHDLQALENRKLLIVEAAVLNVVLAVYIVWYFSHFGYNKPAAVSVGFSVVILNVYAVVLLFGNGRKGFYSLLLAVTTMDLCMNAYLSVHERSLISRETKNTMGYFDASADAAAYLKDRDPEFWRLSKNYNQIDLNDSMFQDYYGEKLYSSTLSAETWEMMDFFDLRVKYSNYFYGFDDKQILRNLTAGKYRLSKNQSDYYGYRLIHTIGDVNIYENQNASGFGVLYGSYMKKSSLEGMDSFQVQEALLEGCLLDEDVFLLQMRELKGDKNAKDFAEVDKKLVYEQGTADGLTDPVIELDGKNSGPLLVKIYAENASGSMTVFSKDGRSVDTVPYHVPQESKVYYVDTLGASQIEINSEGGDIYGYKVYEIDGEELSERIKERSANKFHILEFSDMDIQGYADCSTDQILFLPVPYHKNWKVFVNQKEADILKANAGFMAVVIPKGHAEIRLCYKNYAFYLGLVISIICLIITVLLYAGIRRKKFLNCMNIGNSEGISTVTNVENSRIWRNKNEI